MHPSHDDVLSDSYGEKDARPRGNHIFLGPKVSLFTGIVHLQLCFAPPSSIAVQDNGLSAASCMEMSKMATGRCSVCEKGQNNIYSVDRSNDDKNDTWRADPKFGKSY